MPALVAGIHARTMGLAAVTAAKRCAVAWMAGSSPAMTAGLFLFFLPLSSAASAAEAFVTAQGADALSIVDLSKMETVATLPIGGKPAGVAVSRDGARAFITSPEGKFLTVVDAATRKIEKRIPVEGGPLARSMSTRRRP